MIFIVSCLKKQLFIFKGYFYFAFLGIFSLSTINSSEVPENLQKAKYITISEKNDGFGSQLLRRISAIAFAAFHNKIYLHLPFTKLQHNYDSDINFPSSMESFSNIGLGCPLREISDKTDICEREDNMEFVHRNINFIDKNIDPNYNDETGIYEREDYLYYTDKNVDAYFNKDLLSLLKGRYYSTPKNKIPYFENNVVNVAVHIRRGDVTNTGPMGQWKNDEYYLSIMKRIRKEHPRVIFHIFSEGKEEEFTKFRSLGTVLHLNEDIKTTFHALVSADILVTSKSAFSYTAALLSDGIIYYTNCWLPKLYYWNEIR